jgi:ribonuclease G
LDVLQWFRKKVRAQEAPAPAAPEAVEERPSAAEAGPPGEGGPKPRRRRGTRGGRGRKKTTDAPAKPAAEAKAPERKKSEEDARSRRRRAPSTRRTRTATPRIVLPAVKKEIFVSVEVGEQRVAVLEDGKPAEVYLERPSHRSIAGNIYKGIVDNVLPGMEASFVDIGLDRNGFLYVDEIVVPELEGKRHGRRIQDLLGRGQEVLVQAVKDPMGTKGARLTTEISLPGRFLVYTPFGEGIGISRRLEDAERDRLKAISKELELPEGGIIIRTAAEGASKEELEGDLALLQRLWSTLQARAERTKAPALVYREAELPLRIVRDLFIRDFERVVVDHERTYRRIVGYLTRTSRDLAERVELYTGREPLAERYGVDEAVQSTLNRRVDLPSGGYLIFDYAEAFTVIDVNTGRFVGARGKASGARLEDTITKNNLEAVEEVVRQLRLRDIGGIIVIDFIDMANPKNRALVEEALQRELARDRTKTYVVEISPLGLVEMTRQNVTDGPREILTHSCPTCDGNGIVVSDETHAVNAERELRRLAVASRNQAFRVEVNSRVAGALIGPGASRVAELERETGRRFYFEPRDDAPPDKVTLLERGPISKFEAKGLPVSAGQELELALEAGPDPGGEAVGRVNGYVVSVADARNRIGKTVKVRIERATTAAAYAVLANGEAPEPPVEAGSEVEREDAESGVEQPKPRRRSGGRSRRPAETAAAPADAEPAAEADDALAATEETPRAEGEEVERPKRRTRRGSRGGRGRKKKPAATPADGTVPEAEASVEAQPAVSEPEPEPDTEPEAVTPTAEGQTEGEEKPRKKTRRGSRGGRNRRRKRPAADPTQDGAAPSDETVEEPDAAGPEEPVASVAAPEEPG